VVERRPGLGQNGIIGFVTSSETPTDDIAALQTAFTAERAARQQAEANLIYTGVTRGKCLVVLVGQRKALAIAVKGSRARRRWSKLREWLIGGDTPNRKRAES
jgi:hypothetical protein